MKKFYPAIGEVPEHYPLAFSEYVLGNSNIPYFCGYIRYEALNQALNGTSLSGFRHPKGYKEQLMGTGLAPSLSRARELFEACNNGNNSEKSRPKSIASVVSHYLSMAVEHEALHPKVGLHPFDDTPSKPYPIFKPLGKPIDLNSNIDDYVFLLKKEMLELSPAKETFKGGHVKGTILNEFIISGVDDYDFYMVGMLKHLHGEVVDGGKEILRDNLRVSKSDIDVRILSLRKRYFDTEIMPIIRKHAKIMFEERLDLKTFKTN